MITVAGIFTTRAGAELAVQRTRELGIPSEHINGLFPGVSSSQLETVPTTDAEQPGMGKVMGGVVGGVSGASTGLMGAAVVTAMIPGIGPVVGAGLAAAALLGVGGVIAGAAVGDALEDYLAVGLPKDELFIYEDALRQGRSVVLVLTQQEEQAEQVRQVLARSGAESIDAAREHWWLGVRDAEAEAYVAQGRDFASDEAIYRRGFEAAMHPATAGKSYDEALGFVQGQYPAVYREPAFQRGYERGRAHADGLHGRPLRP